MALIPGKGIVTFEVDSLMLQPADFAISVAIVDRGRTFDYIDRRFPFRVRSSGSNEAGLVQMPGTWEMDPFPGGGEA